MEVRQVPKRSGGYKLSEDQIREKCKFVDLTGIPPTPPIIELINDLGGRITVENAIQYFYWTPFYEKDSFNERVRI